MRDRYGVTVAGGQGQLKGKIVRIAHCGYFGAFDIVIALTALEMALRDLGHELEPGAGGGRRPAGVRRERLGPAAGRVAVAADRTLTDPVPRVLVKEKIADAGVELLRADFDVELGLDWDEAELERRIGEFDAILIRSATKLTAELIDRGRAAEGDRPRRHRGRQRRHGRRHQARDHRRQRARVELDRRRRAHAGAGAGAVSQRPPGARLAGRRRVGALALRRQRALRQDAGRDRLRPHRPAGRQARPGVRHGGGRLRQVRLRRALPRARSRGRRDQRGALPARRRDHDPPAEDPRDRQLDRRRGDRGDARRRADRQLRPRRADRPRCAARRARVGQGRRRGPRRLPRGAVHRAPAVRARRRRRHPAPRRLDRRGPGPRRGRHRRAGARGALRRRGHQRGQHRRRAPRGDGGAGALRARCARSSAGSRRASATEAVDRVEVAFHGRIAEHDTRLLGIAVLVGILSGHTEEPVNLVNAPAMAEEPRNRAHRAQGAGLRRLHRADHAFASARSRSPAPGSARATSPIWSASGARASTCRSPTTWRSSATPTSRG